MAVLLDELMKMDCFKDAELVAGTIENRNIQVEGITIIEVPDIVDWIKGGELLLTSFYGIDKDINAQKNLVRSLLKGEAAALIIKTSRFLTTIPRELINLGNELNFPIIEISGDTKYIDITYPVMGEIFNDRVNKLNYYKKCHKSFTKLSLEMKGIVSVAETLGDLIDNPVIIFDSEFNPIAWNNSKYKDIEIIDGNNKELMKKDHPFYRVNSRILSKDQGEHMIIIDPIKILNEIKGYLGVLEIKSVMQNLDFIAFESASTVLRHEMLKEVVVAEVELKYKGDLMDDIINGRISSFESVYDRSNVFGWNFKRDFVVTLIKMSRYKSHIKDKNSTEDLHLIMGKIKKRIDRISYHYIMDNISTYRGDNVIILWPVANGGNVKDVYKQIKGFGKELNRTIVEIIEEIKISIGIGGVAKDPLEINRSYCEAEDAVNFGDIVFGKGSITAFEELGIYKLLCRYEDRDKLISFVHPGLLKLKEYDTDKNNELLETLETYFLCNLNATKTAEKLFVHYKTVLYRLNRIKEITDLDIEDRDRMLEIEVGLKILHINRVVKQ